MRWKRLAAIAGKTVLALLVATLLLLAASAWFAGTETALRWAAGRAEEMSAGQLTIRGVQGSLYGPLRIESLVYSNASLSVELHEARLQWSPSALLGRRVQIDELSIRELRMAKFGASAAHSEPTTLPAHLRVPLAFSVRSAQLGRFVWQPGDAQVILSDLALVVDKPADTYRLTLSNVTTPWGRGHAEATLLDAPPFTLTARAGFAGDGAWPFLHDAASQGWRAKAWPFQLDATASGTLQRVVLQTSARAQGAKAKVDATVTPFGTRMLADARIDASGIDPARLRTDLPANEFNAVVALRSTEGDAYAGEFNLHGAVSGAWDQGRYPLRSVAARFSGDALRLDLADLVLDLGEAGRFDGSGHVEPERLRLALATRGFDPRGVLSSLRSVPLSGELRLDADVKTQALVADLRHRNYRLQFDASHHDGAINLKQAQADADGASLALRGSLALAPPRRFDAAGTLRRFDPAAFGDYPSAQLNATFAASGQLAPEAQAALSFDIAQSRLRGLALSGRGRLKLSAVRLWDADLALQLASNRLQARGSFGTADDRLALDLAADNLAAIDPALGGSVRASGTFEGRPTAPSGDFDVTAQDLRWGADYRVATLRARGRLDKGLDGVLALDASARGVATPQIRLDDTSLAVHGQRARHRLQLAARNPMFDVAASLAGGWHDDTGWSGEIQSLVNRGRFALRLAAPARLEATAQRVALADAAFEVAGATVQVQDATYDAGRIATRGSFQKLAVAELRRIAELPSEPKSDLMLAGHWQLDANDAVNARVALRRESGDVTLPMSPEAVLGVTRLVVDVNVVDNELRAQLEAAGARLGTLSADAQTRLSRRDGTWGIAGDAPLQANAELAIASLGWAAPLIDPSGAIVFDGAVNARVQARGSVARMEFTGNVQGDALHLAMPAQGIGFTQGSLRAELRDEVLHLRSFKLRGGDGTLSGQGRLALDTPVPELTAHFDADKLEVVSRPDRHVILSGSVDATASARQVRVAAKLKADRGLIELVPADAPSPSDDVVVLGRETRAAPKGSPIALQLELNFDLGDAFFLKGHGLDAQLGGAVKLVSVDGALPSANGSIRVVKGAYSAYGQRLEIERGILNFQGPVDNPGLNVVALRKNQEVQAGVAITGSALAPRVSLTSRPNVPDSEKLSWLVLGRGEAGSGQDFDALQTAAGALLSAGESVTLQQRIAHAAGLEEVGLKGSGALENTVLTLGKRLSSRAYLSYEQGLSGAESLAKINYTLTPRVSLRAQAGSATALDLFYTFSFK